MKSEFNLYESYVLTEGGAGGHIKHPYEIVSNGTELARVFDYIASKANDPAWIKEYVSTKIDGVNGVFRLCHYDGVMQFCLDRGSSKQMDVEGVTVAEIPQRFDGEDRPVYTLTLQLLNRMLPFIYKNLQALGLEPGNQVGLNCEINMPGLTNVVHYEMQNPFLTIHDIVEMQPKPGSKRGARVAAAHNYDREDFKELIKIMDESAQRKKWHVFHKIPVGLKRYFTLDEAFKWQLNINGQSGSLRSHMTNIKEYDPKYVTVKNYKKVLIDKQPTNQQEVNGAIIFLANMGLGQYILNNLNFSNLSKEHEGIVIFDPALKHKLKITGNFMVNRLKSPFAKKPVKESVEKGFSKVDVDYLFNIHKDWEISGGPDVPGISFVKIVKDLEVINNPKYLSDYESIKYWIKQISNGIIPLITIDENDIIWDGFHRLVAAKIAGLDKINVYKSTEEIHTPGNELEWHPHINPDVILKFKEEEFEPMVQMNDGSFKNFLNELKLPGVYINGDWGDYILNGSKTIETRGVPLPEKWKNQKLFILKDSKDGRVATGTVGFSHSEQYEDYESWAQDQAKHLVKGDEYTFGSRKKTYAWYIIPELTQKFDKPVPLKNLKQKIKHTPGGVFEPFEINEGQNSFKDFFKEATMQDIVSFEPPTLTDSEGRKSFDDVVDDDKILEVFERLYELEYKYSMVSSHTIVGGNLKRQENILNHLEKAAKPVIEYIAFTMKNVFQDWLAKHAITNPKDWAEARVKDLMEGSDNGGDLNYGFNPSDLDYMISVMDGEYAKYMAGNDYRVSQQVLNNNKILKTNYFSNLIEISPTLKKVLEHLVELENQDLEYAFEDEDEEREQYDIDTLADLYDGSYADIAEFIKTFYEYGHIDDEDVVAIMTELYEKLIFPLWYDYWAAMGIVETRETVEEVYDDLNKISEKPIRDQFTTINIAINTTHQNGDMMDYYYEMYGVDKGDLDVFSNLNNESGLLKTWNQELKLMGINLNEQRIMSFKELIFEDFNNWTYKLPRDMDWLETHTVSDNELDKIPIDREKLMWDFYLMVGPNNPMTATSENDTMKVDPDAGRTYQNFRIDPNLIDNFENGKKVLLNGIKDTLLKDIMFCVSCEFRHVLANNKAKDILDFMTKHNAGQFFRKYMLYTDLKITYTNISSVTQELLPSNKEMRDRYTTHLSSENSSSYRKAFKAFLFGIKNSKNTLENIMLAIEAAFRELRWSSSYGGDKWGDITKAWTKLKPLNPDTQAVQMQVWIDHIYDLEHNTGTMFNKLNIYKKGPRYDYSWIKDALDYKAISDPWGVWENASPSLKPFMAKILKNSGYGDYETWTKSTLNYLIIFKKGTNFNTIDHHARVLKDKNEKDNLRFEIDVNILEKIDPSLPDLGYILLSGDPKTVYKSIVSLYNNVGKRIINSEIRVKSGTIKMALKEIPNTVYNLKNQKEIYFSYILNEGIGNNAARNTIARSPAQLYPSGKTYSLGNLLYHGGPMQISRIFGNSGSYDFKKYYDYTTLTFKVQKADIELVKKQIQQLFKNKILWESEEENKTPKQLDAEILVFIQKYVEDYSKKETLAFIINDIRSDAKEASSEKAAKLMEFLSDYNFNQYVLSQTLTLKPISDSETNSKQPSGRKEKILFTVFEISNKINTIKNKVTKLFNKSELPFIKTWKGLIDPEKLEKSLKDVSDDKLNEIQKGNDRHYILVLYYNSSSDERNIRDIFINDYMQGGYSKDKPLIRYTSDPENTSKFNSNKDGESKGAMWFSVKGTPAMVDDLISKLGVDMDLWVKRPLSMQTQNVEEYVNKNIQDIIGDKPIPKSKMTIKVAKQDMSNVKVLKAGDVMPGDPCLVGMILDFRPMKLKDYLEAAGIKDWAVYELTTGYTDVITKSQKAIGDNNNKKVLILKDIYKATEILKKLDKLRNIDISSDIGDSSVHNFNDIVEVYKFYSVNEPYVSVKEDLIKWLRKKPLKKDSDSIPVPKPLNPPMIGEIDSDNPSFDIILNDHIYNIDNAEEYVTEDLVQLQMDYAERNILFSYDFKLNKLSANPPTITITGAAKDLDQLKEDFMTGNWNIDAGFLHMVKQVKWHMKTEEDSDFIVGDKVVVIEQDQEYANVDAQGYILKFGTDQTGGKDSVLIQFSSVTSPKNSFSKTASPIAGNTNIGQLWIPKKKLKLLPGSKNFNSYNYPFKPGQPLKLVLNPSLGNYFADDFTAHEIHVIKPSTGGGHPFEVDYAEEVYFPADYLISNVNPITVGDWTNAMWAYIKNEPDVLDRLKSYTTSKFDANTLKNVMSSIKHYIAAKAGAKFVNDILPDVFPPIVNWNNLAMLVNAIIQSSQTKQADDKESLVEQPVSVYGIGMKTSSTEYLDNAMSGFIHTVNANITDKEVKIYHSGPKNPKDADGINYLLILYGEESDIHKVQQNLEQTADQLRNLKQMTGVSVKILAERIYDNVFPLPKDDETYFNSIYDSLYHDWLSSNVEMKNSPAQLKESYLKILKDNNLALSDYVENKKVTPFVKENARGIVIEPDTYEDSQSQYFINVSKGAVLVRYISGVYNKVQSESTQKPGSYWSDLEGIKKLKKPDPGSPELSSMSPSEYVDMFGLNFAEFDEDNTKKEKENKEKYLNALKDNGYKLGDKVEINDNTYSSFFSISAKGTIVEPESYDGLQTDSLFDNPFVHFYEGEYSKSQLPIAKDPGTWWVDFEILEKIEENETEDNILIALRTDILDSKEEELLHQAMYNELEYLEHGSDLGYDSWSVDDYNVLVDNNNNHVGYSGKTNIRFKVYFIKPDLATIGSIPDWETIVQNIMDKASIDVQRLIAFTDVTKNSSPGDIVKKVKEMWNAADMAP